MACLCRTILPIFFVIAAGSETVCGTNEVVKESPDCASDCCPVNPGETDACPDPCATACKCAFLHKRATNGTCIPTRECPPIDCPENETFDTCPVCSESCDNKSPDGKRCRQIGYIRYVVNCQPACRCVENYWRNECDECVPYDECP